MNFFTAPTSAGITMTCCSRFRYRHSLKALREPRRSLPESLRQTSPEALFPKKHLDACAHVLPCGKNAVGRVRIHDEAFFFKDFTNRIDAIGMSALGRHEAAFAHLRHFALSKGEASLKSKLCPKFPDAPGVAPDDIVDIALEIARLGISIEGELVTNVCCCRAHGRHRS